MLFFPSIKSEELIRKVLLDVLYSALAQRRPVSETALVPIKRLVEVKFVRGMRVRAQRAESA